MEKIEKITLKNIVYIKKITALQSYDIVEQGNDISLRLSFKTPKNKNVEYEVEGSFNLTSDDDGNKITFNEGETVYQIILNKDNIDDLFDFLKEEGFDTYEARKSFIQKENTLCVAELIHIFEDIVNNSKKIKWSNCSLVPLIGSLNWFRGDNEELFEDDSLINKNVIIYCYIEDIINKVKDFIKDSEEELKLDKKNERAVFEKKEKETIEKKKQNDEFYTQLEDIEIELVNYKQFFKNKVIYCNCDNPFFSNFCKYFLDNFKELGLKRLICTCYKQNNKKTGLLFDTNLSKEKVYKLEGDGDFLSTECVSYLIESDIVVTTPPFSLIRDFIDLMYEYNKYFLIVAPQTSFSYKNVFPHVKTNEIKPGFNSINYFITKERTLSERFGNIYWLTNLPIKKEIEDIPLYKKYNSREYPKYENANAIEVSKIKNIPCDYNGVMGVPITILLKYNPDQFEIIGISGNCLLKKPDGTLKKVFKRVFLRNKKPLESFE